MVFCVHRHLRPVGRFGCRESVALTKRTGGSGGLEGSREMEKALGAKEFSTKVLLVPETLAAVLRSVPF